ncbi:hypothetical protein BH11BAC3_BH11BAC3_29280 [soil metagenome]
MVLYLQVNIEKLLNFFDTSTQKQLEISSVMHPTYKYIHIVKCGQKIKFR